MSDQILSAQLSDLIRNAQNLPTLPSIALEILRLSQDEEAGIQELTKIISMDPAIAAKVLKMANSSFFRRGDEISSLSRATVVLGMNGVKLLALSFALTDSLPRKGKSGVFDYLHYWKHSVTTAAASRELARLVDIELQEEAFLCGLLSRIGQLVMAETMTDDYASVVEKAGGGLPDASIEQEALGFSHHEVGEGLLKSWDFPHMIYKTILHWEDVHGLPKGSDGAVRELCRILQTVDEIGKVLHSRGSDVREEAVRKLHEFSLRYFGLSEEEIERFFVGLQESIAGTAALLRIDLSDIGDFGSIFSDARGQAVQINLGAAINLEQTFSRAKQLEEENQRLAALAATDKLTDMPNRASFDATLQKVVQARLQGGGNKAVGLLMLDIDHFKSINDTHGHAVGDDVLEQVASRIKASTRRTDFAARYGGEEFVVLVPNATQEILTKIAERLRESVGSSKISSQGRPLSVTISVGGACLQRVSDPEDGTRLLDRVDGLLYEAKEAGRNCCVCR